jgi:hypothetical protein
MSPSTSPNLRLVRSPWKEPKKVESVLDLIGDTPLLQIQRISEGLPAGERFAPVDLHADDLGARGERGEQKKEVHEAGNDSTASVHGRESRPRCDGSACKQRP